MTVWIGVILSLNDFFLFQINFDFLLCSLRLKNNEKI